MHLSRIFLGDGMCSPIGIDLIFSRRFLSDVPDALDVERAIFIILIWHLMKNLIHGSVMIR